MSTVSPSPSAPVSRPKRYHPALVALHWMIFILIFAAAFLGGGGEGGEGRREGGLLIPGVPTLSLHIVLGAAVLVLLVLRLLIRWRTKRPEWAATGSPLLDRVGQLTHWALYFLIFLVLGTGLVLSLQGNRLSRAFGLAGLPTQFTPGRFPRPGFEDGIGRGGILFLIGRLHGLSWALLLLLVLFHVGAALYHQLMLKDNLLGRMWFGRQASL